MAKQTRVVVAVAVTWVVLAAWLLLTSWPWQPRTFTGWVVLVLLGPALYLSGEAFFGWLLSPEHGHSVSRARFSLLRVVVALVAVLLVFGAVWLTEAFIQRYA